MWIGSLGDQEMDLVMGMSPTYEVENNPVPKLRISSQDSQNVFFYFHKIFLLFIL